MPVSFLHTHDPQAWGHKIICETARSRCRGVLPAGRRLCSPGHCCVRRRPGSLSPSRRSRSRSWRSRIIPLRHDTVSNHRRSSLRPGLGCVLAGPPSSCSRNFWSRAKHSVSPRLEANQGRTSSVPRSLVSMIHCWKASRKVTMNSEGGLRPIIFIKRAGPLMRSLDKLSQLGLE